MPVRRHEGRRSQEFLGLQRTPLKTYSPLGWLKSGKRPHQFGLAITLDTGDADDLPSRDFEGYVLETLSAQGAHREVHCCRDLSRLWGECRSEGPSNNHIQEFCVRDLADESSAPNLSVAKHRDAVSDLAKLSKPVRDVDHRGSGLDDTPDAFEKHLGRILVKGRGGLVEHEHSWLDREGLGDLQEVLLSNRQSVGPHAQRNLQPHRIQHLLGGDLCRSSGEHRGRQRDLKIFEH